MKNFIRFFVGDVQYEAFKHMATVNKDPDTLMVLSNTPRQKVKYSTHEGKYEIRLSKEVCSKYINLFKENCPKWTTILGLFFINKIHELIKTMEDSLKCKGTNPVTRKS